MKALLTVILIFLTLFSLQAQDTTKSRTDYSFMINGEIRIRPELDGRDFFNRSYPLTYSTLRSRLSLDKTLFGIVQLYIQIQDSRVLGEERNLQANIKNTDLHQGYLMIKDILDVPLSAQAGKFEMLYGSERFIGVGNWGYIGRTFDGLRLGYSSKAFMSDFFAVTQNSSVQAPANPQPNANLVNPGFDPAMMIYGSWNSFRFIDEMPFDVFGYYEHDGFKTDKKNPDLDRLTAGLSLSANFSALTITAEGAYQTGQSNVRNISGADTTFTLKDIGSYTASVMAAYNIKPMTFGLGFDMISGTDPKDAATKINTYSSNLATGHKLYGYMDYFTDMPKHTANLGLNDAYITFKLGEKADKLTFQAYGHYFMSAVKSADNLSVFGQELDLVLNYTIIAKVASVQWGGSLFLPGELMKKLYGGPNNDRTDPAFWSYIMATVSL